MKTQPLPVLLAIVFLVAGHASGFEVSIRGEDFLFDGKPTLEGREWNGMRLEGLLPNSRMVQGIFDDLNPETKAMWAYPDTKEWDAERNTREFIAAMPEWRANGLLAFTINLQGGSPQGYSKQQPWHNSAIQEDGSLRAEYLARLERIIRRAEELRMAVILGLFYFGQDQRLRNEAAVVRAADEAAGWVLRHGWRHVLIEINNEANVKYDHEILQPGRVHELIARVQGRSRDGFRLLVSTSFGGGAVPPGKVIEAADFILIHGNGVSGPANMTSFIGKVKSAMRGVKKPVVINEDDHFDFDQPDNNFLAAAREHVSWGFFDYRQKGEGFEEGFQSVPVSWGIGSGRKKGFFGLLRKLSGF